jgi:general secretion pathway protein H
MTLRSDFGSAGGSSAGFTMIELIVVLAILGLAMALVTSNAAPVSPATHARAAAREIAQALRAARAEALTTNRSIWFTLDTARHLYRSGAEEPQSLPSDLSLALLTDRKDIVGQSVGRLRFDPDGGASGGRISVAGGGRVWWVGVDWLSGRVSLAEKTR